MLWTNLGVQKIKNTPMLHSSYIYNLAAKGSYRQIDMLGGGGALLTQFFFCLQLAPPDSDIREARPLAGSS